MFARREQRDLDVNGQFSQAERQFVVARRGYRARDQRHLAFPGDSGNDPRLPKPVLVLRTSLLRRHLKWALTRVPTVFWG